MAHKLHPENVRCLKESKARKLLDEAIQHKSTICLALLGEVMADVKDLKRSIGKVRKELSDAKRQNIYAWLEQINPTRDHNNALGLHEENTCQWINRQPEWQDCLAGTHRCIWIHGIPGAGKTILAPYVIEQTQTFCSGLLNANACLYYYYSYRHTSEDGSSALLKWIISQLCRETETIPEVVVDMYDKNTTHNFAQLLKALGALVMPLDVVYIVIDAVDECNNRADLLALIRTLMSDLTFVKLRLLVTSRNYLDIDEALKPLSMPISMSNPLVDDDIRIYITSKLDANPKVSNWPPALKTEVVDALVKGAKGM